MTRSVLIVTTVTALGFGAYSAYLFNSLQAERAASAELRERVGLLETAVQARPAPVFATAPMPGPPVADMAAPQTTARSGVLPAPRRVLPSPNEDSNSNSQRQMRDRMRAAMAQQQELMNNPEYRAAMREQRKIGMRQMYPELEEATGMSRDQADRLFELLTDQQMNDMDNQPRADGDTRQWIQQLQQRQRELDSQLAAELGSDTYNKWKEYQGSLPARFQVRSLNAQLGSAGVPLRGEQAENLVAALRGAYTSMAPNAAQQPRNMRSAAGVSFGGATAGSDEFAQRQREAVRPILTPQQFAEYEKIQEQQEQMRQASMRMMQAQMEALRKSGNAPADGQVGLFAAPTGMLVPGSGVVSSGFNSFAVPLSEPAASDKTDLTRNR